VSGSIEGESAGLLDLAKTWIRLPGKSQHEAGARLAACATAKSLSISGRAPPGKARPTSLPKLSRVGGSPHRADDLKRSRARLRTGLYENVTAVIRANELKEIVPEYRNEVAQLREETDSSHRNDELDRNDALV
jgi:hypothetical protein